MERKNDKSSATSATDPRESNGEDELSTDEGSVGENNPSDIN